MAIDDALRPTCCDGARDLPIEYMRANVIGGPTSDGWCIDLTTDMAEARVRISFCPFCGTQLAEPTKPLWQISIAPALRRLTELRQGWDSYGALPIDRNTLARALAVLSRVMPPDAPAPQAVPLNDGGVQFEWHVGGIDLEFEVHPRGTMRLAY